MADDADIANDATLTFLAASFAAIDAAIPLGVAGECEDCGEEMPRLVGGLCGFCRDGRRPPLSFYENRRPIPPTTTAPILAPAREDYVTVPNSNDSKVVSVPAKGAVLAAIIKTAEEHDLPFGQAVIKLIEEGFERETDVAEAALSSLADFDLGELIDEVRERFDRSNGQATIDAAIQRAEAAEGKLAALRELIAG